MFKKILIVAFVTMLGAGITGIKSSPVQAAGDVAHPASQEWTTDGLFGFFDRKQLKRGWQVYSEICASCHSVRLLFYRNLQEMGLAAEEVKKIAAEAEVAAGPNEDGETHNDGELIVRPGKAFDKIVSPYPNDLAARAANAGALPPDLSLMTKARVNGANYLHALLTGYKDAPSGFKMSEDMNYNPYFPGSQIAMGEPLSDEGVEYADGTKATVDQMAKDVTAFLIWAAEPELEDRKRMGVKVMLFLIIFTALLYAVKRQVWAKLH
ncbi:MAG: cytochrome c1 [Rhodospirillaceae bacterium]|jgi:ubiquinol-cytochrome c reductase cytochrome c1 subunit|nr:cytochrome c1 [Rhodospirillaceae bacterium]MBT4938776.1 cytochrome c1 [Rhodospirillaceae bacterium]MBT7957492.1 cytochrome c1 [Rhodospirillaceae bacterium]